MSKYDYELTGEPEHVDSGSGYERVDAIDCDGNEVGLNIWQCDDDLHEGDRIRSDAKPPPTWTDSPPDTATKRLRKSATS